MTTQTNIVMPTDTGDAISKILLVLADEVRRNPELQRRLAAVLAPVVTVRPHGVDDCFRP